MTDFSKMSDEELRVEVAKAVGWKWNELFLTEPSGRTIPRNATDYTKNPLGAVSDVLMMLLPYYSTSIADAWELVAQAERDGFWLKIHSPFVAGDSWHAGFTPLGVTGWNGRPDYEGVAPTAPRAICLAFLATRTK